MKLETTNYPCAHCKFGHYMNVDEKWWCSKHNMYGCEMERNHVLCEKLKTWEFIKEIEEEINSPNRGTCDYFIVDRIEEIIDRYKAEITQKSAQESFAIERYQDLVDYFDDEDVAKIILENREEFKKWLDRIRWHVEKADELARKVDRKPCEDCVSRQAVLDMATVIETDDYSGNEIMEVVDTEDIKALPSVTPAPKKGKWIANHDESDDSHTVNCSCCGYRLVKVINSNFSPKLVFDSISGMAKNYCPNCGAKLEVEE